MQNSEKSAMIITYDMIPYAPWGSCQRMYFLADYLQNNGYNIFVVHAQKSKHFGDYGHSIRFQTLPILSSEQAVFTGYNASINRGNRNRLKELVIDFVKSENRMSNPLLLEKIAFNEPNLGMGICGYLFTKSAKAKIFRTISERKIKHVIISGPPFSLFRLAPQIKKRFPEVNVILDYRDPWNTPYRSYRIPSLAEQDALNYADKVVFLNNRMLDDISSKYNLPKERCAVVWNGYSKQDWDEVNRGLVGRETCHCPPPDKMIIAHVGGISFTPGGYRDLSSFLEAFKIFQKDKNVLLRFVGVAPSDKVEQIKCQFHGTLEVLPPVGTQIALNYMLNSDVLFLNHTDDRTGRYVLTGKFFDYIRSGKVILGVASSKNTYFMELIQKHHLGIVSLTQPAQMLECLELLYDKWMKGSLGQLRRDDGLDIEQLSREAQNDKYLQLLKDLESNKITQ